MQYLVYQNKKTHQIESLPVQDEETTKKITFLEAVCQYTKPVEANDPDEAVTLSITDGFVDNLSRALRFEAKSIERQIRQPGITLSWRRSKIRNRQNQESLRQYKI